MKECNKKIKNINIKIWKIALVAIISLLWMCMINSSKAATEVSNGVTWEYEVENGEAVNVRIKDDTTYPLIIEIPETLGGYNVVSIGNGNNNIVNKKMEIAMGGPVIGPEITEVKMPNTVKKINPFAFNGFKEMERITFSNTLEEIGDYSFANCILLEHESGVLNIPNSVTKIGNFAFSINLNRKQSEDDLSGYTNPIYFDSSNGTPMASVWWVSIGYGNFRSINFGTGVTTIGDAAFEGCTALNSLTIPNNVTSIGKAAFSKSGITQLNLPNNGITVGERAFKGCYKLQNVTITEAINLDEGYVFEGAGITTVNLDGVEKIPNGTFADCSKLNTVNLENNKLKILGDAAFKNCSSLNVLQYNKIVEKVERIGNSVFQNCKGLEGSLEVKNIVQNLGSGVFAGCKNLQNVTINSNIESIPASTFSNCTGLLSVTHNAKYISSKAFEFCTSITNEEYMNITSNIEQINDNAFKNCTGITGELTFSSTVNHLWGGVFENCTGITSLVVPSNITVISDNCFKNCSNIENLTFNEGLEYINASAFQNGYKNINQIVFPSTLIYVGDNAFQSSTEKLDEVYFGKNEAVVRLGYRWYGRSKPIVHFGDCTHDIEIVCTLPGVTVVNNNGQSEYACGSNQTFEVKIAEGYSYPELAIKVLSEGQYIDSNVIDETASTVSGRTITFNNLKRNKKIIVQRTANGTDLVLREFISKINGKELKNSREPEVEINGMSTQYLHTKYPVSVNNNDLITYTIRVYNEGNIIGKVKEITQFLPDGLTFEEDNEINTQYGWSKLEDGKTLKTSYLKGKDIESNGVSEDIQLVCKINMAETEYGELEDVITINAETVQSGLAQIENNSGSSFIVENDKLVLNSESQQSVNYVKIDLIGKKGKHILNVNAGVNTTNSSVSTYLEVDERIRTDYLAGNLAKIIGSSEVKDYTMELMGGKVYYLIIKTDNTEVIINNIKVTETEKNSRLVTIAEITNGNTLTTLPGSIKKSEINNDYKKAESYASSNDTYVQGTEADDDYENVELKLLKQVGYTLKIQKVDSITSQLLDGAKFNLLNEDEEIIAQATTENGELNFGNFSSFGEGIDTYYIEEDTPPAGYKKIIDGRIELKVIKNIDAGGNVTIEIECDLLETLEDTSKYTFIPVYTKEQLAKIGTGETITIDGKECVFAQDANYILKADIDLAGSNWTPIAKMNGVLEGDNHIISNLTISGENYNGKEIGLFAEFAGIIKNVTLKDVGIRISGINESATSTYNQNCAGAFIGLAENATIQNCKVTGSINTNFENIGGFIGHSKEGNIVIFEDCTNEADVVGAMNVGGLIGCSKSALNINGCTNSGNIETIVTKRNEWDHTLNGYNAGGLVGYAIPTNYEVKNLEIGYDDTTKTITLVVKNEPQSMEYTLKLQKVDAEKSDKNETIYLDGAKFNIYDKDKKLLYENIEIKNGKLDVAQIEGSQTDVFFMKEMEPPKGYDILVKDYVKIKIEKMWDAKAQKFVLVATGGVTNEITDKDVVNNSGNTNGKYSITEYQNVRWKANKVNIVNSSNTGNVKSDAAAAAGLIAAGITNLKINNCSNSGNISDNAENGGYSHIAGIAGNILGQDKYSEIEICNTVNTGSINNSKKGSVGECAGILAITDSNLKIKNCSNTGNITTDAICSGIIATAAGNNTEIIGCNNSGKLTGDLVGGIIGQSKFQNLVNCIGSLTESVSENLIIKQCSNTGELYGGKLAGIVAYTLNQNVDVSYCKSENYSAQIGDGVVNVGIDAAFSGIIGQANAEYINVNYCSVNNVACSSEMVAPYHIGGIIGSIFNNIETSKNIYNVNIGNCDVKNFNIDSHASGVAGIVGDIFGNGGGFENVNIYGCHVDNMQTKNTTPKGITHIAGIVGACNMVSNLQIQDCTVNRYMGNNNLMTGPYGDADSSSAGIIGLSWNGNTSIKNCIVTNSNIQNNTLNDISCSATGGIIAINMFDSLNIENCDIIDTIVTGPAGDTGGIAGHSLGTTNISNCNVRGNSKIACTKEIGNHGQNCVGGIIGYAQREIYIKDSNVLGTEEGRITILGKDTSAVAGILGCTTSSAKIKNSGVDYADIMHDLKNDYSTCVTGGIIGYTSGGEIVDCNVSNSSVSDNTFGGSASTGGIIGCSVSRIIIDNCNVYKTQINDDIEGLSSGGKAVGGIAGHLSGGEITNTTIEESEINTIARVTGGIVGSIYGDISNSNVISVNINAGNCVDELMTIGGIASVVNSGKMSNNTVDNLKITSETNANIGGLIGVNIVETQIENCKVLNNTVLENKKTYVNEKTNPSMIGPSMMGGIVALSTKTIELINPQILDIQLKIAEGEETANHMGGLVGYADNVKVSVTDDMEEPIINNLTMENSSDNGIVGGIVGVVNEDADIISEIKNVKLQNITATGTNHIGGLLGCGKAIIDNANLKNINLTGTKSGAVVGGAVGILIPSSSINNVTVTADDASEKPVISSASVAGGIVGLSDVTLTNCKVENMKIKTTGAVETPSGNVPQVGGSLIKAIASEIVGILIEGVQEPVGCESLNCTVEGNL